MKTKDILILIFAIGIACILMRLVGITCPIKWFTGISCAGCGMTRAWIQLLQGNLHEAFRYHPLWFFPALFGVVYVLKNKMDPRLYNGIVYSMLAIFILVYLYRFTLPQDIVVFEPTHSIVFRLIQCIKK